MNKLFVSLSVVAAGIVLAGCGNNQKTENTEGTSVPSESSLVSVSTAVMQDVPQTEIYSTTVEAFAVNNIAPQTGGRIETIKVDVGSFVSKGQVLAIMESSQLDQTRLKLVNDSTELSRLKSLYEEGGLSKSDYDASEMAYKVSRRSYQNLVDNTFLRSPINGVITARNYDSGDLYGGQPIFVVEQISPVKLLVGVSESDYTLVKVGNEVQITVDALPGETFTGKINKKYPTMDAATHTFKTEILVTNANRVLRPGMYAKAKIEFGVNHSVVVPDNAVVKLQGAGQRSVFILQPDSTVVSSVVKLGRHMDKSYEILEGVSEGDVVVVKGNTSLKNHATVSVSNR